MCQITGISEDNSGDTIKDELPNQEYMKHTETLANAKHNFSEEEKDGPEKTTTLNLSNNATSCNDDVNTEETSDVEFCTI